MFSTLDSGSKAGMTSQQRSISKILLYVLSIIGVLLFLTYAFSRITTDPIQRWDEQTNLSVVEDTIDSEEYFSLSYYQENSDSFFEKPPLWYWIGITFSYLPGETIVNLRLISLASFIGICSLLFLELLRQRLPKLIALGGGLGLLLIPHLFILNPTGIFSTHTIFSADLDFLQIFLILLSFSLLNSHEEKKNRNFLIWAGIVGGLAFMTKGPLGLILVVVWGIYKTIQLFDRKIKLRQWVTSTLTPLIFSLMIILPWHIYMYNNFGNTWLNSYLGYHIYERMAISLEGHTGHTWMYLQYFINPAINLLGVPAILGIFYIGIKKWEKVLSNFSVFYPITSFVLITIIIQLMETKIAWYLLPLYPFSVLIVGYALLGFRQD